MLTDKQIENIHKLDSETQLQIMHECAEALGLVCIPEFCDAMSLKRRTAYDYIENKKIKTFNIGIHKFPLINYNLNQKA